VVSSLLMIKKVIKTKAQTTGCRLCRWAEQWWWWSRYDECCCRCIIGSSSSPSSPRHGVEVVASAGVFINDKLK